MKRILFFLLLFSQVARAQSNDTTKYTYYRFLYGNMADRIWPRLFLHIPYDSLPNAMQNDLCAINGVLYIKTATYWKAAGGSPTDTTSLSNQINGKLNISDTASMLGGYTRVQRFLDSLSAHRTTIAGKQAYGDTSTFDATRWWVMQQGFATGSGVTDGDKGDVTVSGSGATWTLDSVVKDSKIIDSSISIRKLNATGVKDSTTVLSGDNKFHKFVQIDLTGIATGDFLKYNGSTFVKQTPNWITNVRRSRDSIYATINGVESFVYKDSLGGGSSVIDSIQRVGSAGIAVGNIGIDTTVNRLMYKAGTSFYHVAITDSIDATSYDVDAQDYINRVNATDVTLTTSQKIAINNYVVGLKADTLWSEIYDQGIPVWGTAASSAIMLKGTHTVTWVNSPSFSSAGVTGNGTSSYGNLNFSPTSAGTQDNAHLAIYIQNNVSGSGIDIGAATLTPTRVTYMNTKSGAGTTHHINDGTNSGGVVSSSAGFSLANRTVSTGIDFYKNGAFVSTAGATSTGVATDNFALCAYNGAGTVQSFSTRQISFWSAGSGLTASNATKLSTRVNTLMTALGINVY